VTLNVAVPAHTLAPPGYYMLFVVEEGSGSSPCDEEVVRVPSVAKFVQLL
jgi:hypothetical protein